jgi:hypothetical protein
MDSGFDPYYTWLGIRPDEQPADHYRLLGVRQFEDNADAIANAMDQRMHFLRTLQVGKRAAESQALLNAISAAAGCLLDAPRKAEYDRQLRAQLASRSAAAAPAALPSPPPAPTIQPLIVGRPASSLSPRPASNSPFTATLALSLAALIGLPLIGLVGLGLARLLPTGDPRPERNAPDRAALAASRVDLQPAPPVMRRGEPTVLNRAPPAETNPALPQAGAIDLLAVDQQDVRMIRGGLRRLKGAIETNVESTAFAIPVAFPREYRLEAEVVRRQGKNSLCFGFLVQGRPLSAVIDGFNSQVSGLASVGGKEIFTAGNPLAKPGAVLTNGRSATVRIEVTEAAVDLSVDGKSIASWKNDPQIPIRSAQGMSCEGPESLCIFAWDASYRFTRLEIVPLAE